MWISCDFLLPKRILIGSISWSHEADLDLDPPKWSTTLLNSNKEQRSVSLWTGSLCSYPFSEKTDPTKNLLKNCWFKNKNNDCFCLFISLLFMCVITNTKSNFNQNKLRFFLVFNTLICEFIKLLMYLIILVKSNKLLKLIIRHIIQGGL